jgi:hypothetical protein
MKNRSDPIVSRVALSTQLLMQIGCAFAVLCESAFAGSATYSDHVFLHEPSPAADILTVPKWNPADYPESNLVSVEITTHVDMTLADYFGNLNHSAVDATFDASGSFQLYLPGYSSLIVELTPHQTLSQTFDGYPIDFPGEYFPYFLISLNALDTGTRTYTGVDDVTSFVGEGDVVLPIEGSVELRLLQPLNLPPILSRQPYDYPFAGATSISVTYHWASVPEPSGILLFLVGVFGLLLKRRGLRLMLILGVILATHNAQQSFATVIPPNLPPGSQYRLVFVTDGVRDATSASIADYDSFVAAEAARNSLLPITTWHAIAGTELHPSVVLNTGATQGLPIYNMRGDLVEAGNGLYQTLPLLNPIKYNQFGEEPTPNYVSIHQTLNLPPGVVVWTGLIATPTGITSQTFFESSLLGNSLGFPRSVPGIGTSSSVDGSWAAVNSLYPILGSLPMTTPLAFYGLSDPILVPVPEPATANLFAVGVVLLAFAGRHCSRRLNTPPAAARMSSFDLPR